jgi:hypothetical protein
MPVATSLVSRIFAPKYIIPPSLSFSLSTRHQIIVPNNYVWTI